MATGTLDPVEEQEDSAQIAEQDVNNSDQQAESSPPQRGRPAGVIQLPKNADSITQEGMLDFISGLSSVGWEQFLLYGYRWDPVYDSTNGGQQKKYIFCQAAPVTEESLKQEYGSGTYQLQLNRRNPKTRKTTPAMDVNITIFDPNFPPNLPPGDWLNHPKNKKWLPFAPLIEKRWADRMKAQTSAPAAGDGQNMQAVLVQMQNETRQMVEKLRSDLSSSGKDQLMTSVFAMLPALLQQQDPTKLMSVLKDYILPKEEKSGPDPMLQFLLQRMEQAEKQHHETMLQREKQHAEEMRELRAQQSKQQDTIVQMLQQKNEPPNLLSQLGQVKELVSAVTEMMPSGPKKWTETLVEEGLPQLVELGKSYFTAQALKPRPQAPAQQVHNMPAANPAPAQALPAPVNPPPAITPEVVSHPQQSQPEQQQQGEMDSMLRGQIIEMCGRTSQALDLGLTGAQFADQLIFKYGQARYDFLINAIPEEQLLPILKQVPEGWQYLAQHEALLPQFIKEFYEFANQPEEEEIEPPKPVKASASKGGKKKS